MSWILFTFLAINLWCISNILDKNVVSKRIKNPIMVVGISSVACIFFALMTFLFFRASLSFIGFAFGLLYTGILLLYYRAMQLDEASRVVALYSITPLIVAIFAYIFLKESFGSEKYLGVVLLIIGAVMITLKKDTRSKAIQSTFIGVMAILLLLWSTYEVALKYFVGIDSFISIFASMQLGLFLGGVAMLFWYRNKLKLPDSKSIGIVLTSQVTGAGGLLSFIYAVSLGPVSLVSALGNTQSIFLLLYTTVLTIFRPHIIKEDISRGPLFLKALAIITMVIGAYLVSI